ncbi:MAG: PLDc N-terminal domain-containing protein [Epsilonproteobacteria bacterium]|nr:PLDc N-terminal domain-containing protein [Campylobacterota bacterium]
MNLDIITEYLTLHIVTIITFFISFITIAHMLSQRKKPSVMIAWTVAIITLPYLGVLLYVLFNGRKIGKNRRYKKRVSLQNIDENSKTFYSPIEDFLNCVGIAEATKQNHFYLCKDGSEAYQKIIHHIQNAKHTIYISTYIFGNDTITKTLLIHLTKKAKEGIEVKILIDAIGSFSLELYPKILKPLRRAGGEYHFFMSLLKQPFANKFNLRNHRKMIIIDDDTVISGGINLSEKYLSKNDNHTIWEDLSFILQGAATKHYLKIFKDDWESQTGQSLINTQKTVPSHKKSGSIIQVVPSGPDVNNDALYESILYALFLAQKRIWIVTPYFVPDGALMDALIIAKHRGVEVKVILPAVSDHFFADISRSGFLRDLQKESIEVLFYTPKMLHAKALLIDELALVGSSNFDARSFFYNFEVMSFLYSKKDIIVVEQWIKTLLKTCTKGLKPAGKLRILSENIFKMLSPAL